MRRIFRIALPAMALAATLIAGSPAIAVTKKGSLCKWPSHASCMKWHTDRGWQSRGVSNFCTKNSC
jgi:hypothetical protein